MIRSQRLTSLNQFDLEALQQLCDAEDLGLPCPDLPTDTLFRLGRLDCLTGDRERLVKTSANGRRLLAEAPGLH